MDKHSGYSNYDQSGFTATIHHSSCELLLCEDSKSVRCTCMVPDAPEVSPFPFELASQPMRWLCQPMQSHQLLAYIKTTDGHANHNLYSAYVSRTQKCKQVELKMAELTRQEVVRVYSNLHEDLGLTFAKVHPLDHSEEWSTNSKPKTPVKQTPTQCDGAQSWLNDAFTCNTYQTRHMRQSGDRSTETCLLREPSGIIPTM